jgi:hypothetical protein
MSKEKRDVTIGVSFQVSKQFLSDTLVGMAETCPEMLVWFGDEDTEIVRIEDTEPPHDWLNPGSVVRITGRYDGKRSAEGSRRYKATIDFASVVVGLQRVAHADIYAELKGRILQACADNDCGQIDSEAADVIAQLAVYGEVVYG